VYPANHFILTFPAGVTAGVSANLNVKAYNTDYSATATGYSGDVQFTSSDGNAILPAEYTYTTNDAGIHDFNITLKTVGSRSITVTDPDTYAQPISSIVYTSVSPGAIEYFKVELVPDVSTVTAGTWHDVKVTAYDNFNNRPAGDGNVKTDYTGTVTSLVMIQMLFIRHH
jgi:hypothetical protein